MGGKRFFTKIPSISWGYKKVKRVLLTGATGFVGRHVASELLERGYTVYAVSTSMSLPETEGLIQCNLDLFDIEAVEKFLKESKFENIIHLAWYLGPKYQNSELNLDWTSSSINLLKLFKENGGKKALFAGTMSEYDFFYGYLQEGITPLNNSSLYGKCKASLYEVASAYAKQNDIDFNWPRIFNIYGPFEKESRLMPAVICSILNNEDIKVSTCTKIQDFLHIFDVASAIVNLFESDVQGAVNISSGTPVKLRVIVEKIAELMDYKGKILFGAVPTNFDEPFVVGSNERLIKEVGWEQKISLEEGLMQTIDWWKTSCKKKIER